MAKRLAEALRREGQSGLVIPVAASSAVLAILLVEPERAQFKRFLFAHEVRISRFTDREPRRGTRGAEL
jgi:hypothetical protein